MDHPSLQDGLGRLYGVGAGPGASDLLTRRAERVLRSCPVICVPARTGGASYVWHTVEDVVDPARQQVITLRYPMRREADLALPARQHTAEAVLEHLLAGRDVAFVTEGDPLLFSTFSYVLEALRQRAPQISVEVVPGVSSVTAAAAATLLPLAAGAERVAIVPATYALGAESAPPGEDTSARSENASAGQSLEAILLSFETVVLLKVHSVFDRLLALLERLDLLQHAVYVRRCGSEAEEVVYDLAGLRGQALDYFSLVIVRNPHVIGSK